VAGRVDWPAAWFFLALLAVYLALGGWWFFRHDPELLEERMTTAPNAPHWDRLFVRIYWIVLPTFFTTAALDAGRFCWSDMPAAIQVIGAAAIVGAFVVIWWCTAANHFLSSNARIQIERGQRVVQDGPYRFVRHPMYTSIIVLMIGMALILGSWLAVVPALLIAVLLVVRTSLEDRMLKTELAGYREYASRVPERLIPGVW
jgi:protein-S-isoprenylcysteine O-methyltransferase Ste14